MPLILLLALFCLTPLVRRHLLPAPAPWVAALAAGFGASVGGLTLWMLFLGLLPGRPLSALTASIFPAAMLLWGLWPAITNYQSPSFRVPRLAQGWLELLLLLAIVAALAVTLVHSLYYPFVGEDEVSRYAYNARLVFDARNIPASVTGYPLLLPLGYAYAFFLGGGIAEHLAKIVSWLFAPATVAATYWLAALWAGRRAGLLAAFTLAVTRLFVDWSPLGYVDIPTGLYFALAAGFASLWLQRGAARHALAAGAAAGLALWTKQAGFSVVLSLGLVFATVGLLQSERRRAAWLAGLASLALAGLIGLPWYVRNVALGGWQNAVPGPGDFYYQQAHRALLDWIPFLPWAEEFGYGVVALYLFGLVAGLTAILRPDRSPHPKPPEANDLRFTFYVSRITDYGLRIPLLLLAAFLLPYLALWWNWFSYDPRFLLTVLPFYAALTGLGGEWLAARIAWRPQPVLAAALAGALLFSGVYTRLGGAYRLVTAPFATDAEKLLQYKPDVASTVAFLRQTARPGQDRIYSMDPRLGYYLLDYEVTTGYPTTLAQLIGYQYLVAGSWAFNDVYPRLGAADNEIVRHLEDPQALELLFTSELGTVKVYRVQVASSQAER